MPNYEYYVKFPLRYDLNLRQTFAATIRCDGVRPPHAEMQSGRHAVLPFRSYVTKSFFASDAYAGFFHGIVSFHYRGRQFLIAPARCDAASYRSGARFRYAHDFLLWQRNGIRQRFSAIDPWPVPRQVRFRGTCDLFVAVRQKFFDRFAAVGIDRKNRFASRFDRIQLKRVRLPNRWIAIPCEFRYKAYLRFNAVKKEFYRLCANRRAFVRPGWRILATNIMDGKQYDLGFINADAEKKSIVVFDDRSSAFYDQRPTGAGDDDDAAASIRGQAARLPDGDYEISVLTSSLFWKDCSDRNIRTLSIRPGEEVSPLPVVYNLRSSISQGQTTIRWSANKSDVADCVFGVWYSNESPVDTDRPCDNVVWYYPSQSEYQTTFAQNAPAWVAVAAMRTGDESEAGKVHDLYLDWSSIPPRAPDDVVVLDPPLPVVDNAVEPTRNENEEDGSFWTQWPQTDEAFGVVATRSGFPDFGELPVSW